MQFRHIGFGWDSPVNLVKGEQVYNFVRTLEKNYLFDNSYSSGLHKSLYFFEIPGYENGHPPAYSFIVFIIGNFFSMLFGFKYYFFHLANIIFTAFFLYFFQKFTYQFTKSLTISIVSSLVLISIPHFFVYSIVNIKDLPVALFTFFGIYSLLLFKPKDLLIKIIVVQTFVLLALYSKFTAIYLFPVILYLSYLDKNLYKFVRGQFWKVALLVSSYTILFTCVFWPHLIFNFSYELERLKFVYMTLPENSVNDHFFVFFFVEKLPLVFLILFGGSILYGLAFSREKKLLAFWFLPIFLYLIFVNRYYEAFRQFLFIFVFSAFSLALALNKILARHVKNFFVTVFLILSLISYSMYYFLMPSYKKIFFSSVFFSEGSKDIWGLSLPEALDYVEKKYAPTRIYFSPLAFLLEYYEIREKGWEIIYQPEYSNIWVTTTKVNPYEEERLLRENYYIKDSDFKHGEDVLEVWVKRDYYESVVLGRF